MAEVVDDTGDSQGPVRGGRSLSFGDIWGGNELVAGVLRVLVLVVIEGGRELMESECEDAKLRSEGVVDVFLLTSPMELALDPTELVDVLDAPLKNDRFSSDMGLLRSVEGVGVISPPCRMAALPMFAIRIQG